MTEHRINYEQRDSWPEFNPLDYECDVPGCGAIPGVYCDEEHRGIHADRGLDELIKICAKRKEMHNGGTRANLGIIR